MSAEQVGCTPARASSKLRAGTPLEDAPRTGAEMLARAAQVLEGEAREIEGHCERLRAEVVIARDRADGLEQDLARAEAFAEAMRTGAEALR